MPASGQIGNSGGGRPGHGLDKRVATLKGYLVDAVIEDCELNPPRKLYWAEKFKDKLMPNEIKGTGDNGEIIIKTISYADTAQIQAEILSTAITQGNGQRSKESVNNVEPS